MSHQNKILVAMDFSESSMNALELSFEFAKIHDAELILVYITESSGSKAKMFIQKNPAHTIEEAVTHEFEELIAKYQDRGRSISFVIKSGTPYKTILELGHEHDVELIVMGTHGWEDGLNGKKLLGANGVNIVRKAECPVVTVKKIKENQELKKILIPVDKDFGIREIRSFLKDFHGKYEDHIELISVLPKKAEKDPDKVNSWDKHLKKQRIELAKIGFGNTDHEILFDDYVDKAIVGYAEAHINEIDLIMMETHGRAGINRIFKGSVTEAVINQTLLPVFSLRPNREERKIYAASGY